MNLKTLYQNKVLQHQQAVKEENLHRIAEEEQKKKKIQEEKDKLRKSCEKYLYEKIFESNDITNDIIIMEWEIDVGHNINVIECYLDIFNENGIKYSYKDFNKTKYYDDGCGEEARVIKYRKLVIHKT